MAQFLFQRITLCLLIALAPVFGCAATTREMQRAQEAYDEARFDAARAWLVELEASAPSMDSNLRTRYFYFRGMAEYRLGHRLEALHYLAVAGELEPEAGGLREEQRELLTRTLSELQPREPLAFWPPESAER